MIETEQSYVAAEAKRRDYDRWLATLFATPAHRDGIFALLAFNGEIASIRETVSEVLLGDIRLQWWRDAIMEIGTGFARSHPVVEALDRTVSTYHLDKSLLSQMIDSRSLDLNPCPFETVDELLTYADGTGGILNELIHRVLGRDRSAELTAAREVGRAFALTGIIRAIPFHMSQDLVLIPKTMLAVQGLSSETLFLAENRAALFLVVEEMAQLAERVHRDALQQRGAKKPQFQLSRLTGLYLSRLRAAGFDPADKKMTVGVLRKIIALSLGR